MSMCFTGAESVARKTKGYGNDSRGGQKMRWESREGILRWTAQEHGEDRAEDRESQGNEP